ncbi:MAG: hypothetical protein ACREAB_09395 [Blastocatellia bacterium]
MDGLTLKAALAIGVVLLIGLLWLVWKFFAKLFKHVVIMLLIGGSGAAYYYYRSLPPPPPYVGKHAYMKANGEYVGVVEGQDEDNRRGPVWIIRPAGGSPMRYAKARVTLKDKMELKPKQTPASIPESKPATNKDKNASKVEKKKN